MPDRQPLKPLEAAFVADACKALAHPARVRILEHLLDHGRRTCGDIVTILPLAQSTVSQHLGMLRQAGLVTGETEGRKTGYRADRERLARLNDFLAAMLGSGVKRDG